MFLLEQVWFCFGNAKPVDWNFTQWPIVCCTSEGLNEWVWMLNTAGLAVVLISEPVCLCFILVNSFSYCILQTAHMTVETHCTWLMYCHSTVEHSHLTRKSACHLPPFYLFLLCLLFAYVKGTTWGCNTKTNTKAVMCNLDMLRTS